MPMYDLLEYSDNYSMTPGKLWNCDSNEINDSAIEINDDSNEINNNKTITSKSFEHKTILIGRTPEDNSASNAEFAVSLKYLSIFWRFLNLPLTNCEIKLNLSFSKNCIISEISTTPRIPVNPDANPPCQEVVAIQTTGATIQINNTKLYVTVVPLLANDNIKFLENIKQGCKRTIP